jgi:hypothetical protein
MNEKEIGELRRRVRPDKSSITHVRGCYVNENKEIIAQFDQSLALMTQEEGEKFLALLRKTLTGTLGKNLVDITFSTQQVVDSPEHKLLMALRDSALKDEQAVQELFQRCIASLELEGNYLILLAYDVYDVPYRSKDGEKQADAGEGEVFSYVLCSICPVKPTKPGLSYQVRVNEFREQKLEDLVSPPELGFLFPAFDDRSTNLYNALYYTRDTAQSRPEFIDAVFRTQPPMPAQEQQDTFQSILGESLGEECSYEVVQSVHQQFCDLIQEHKDSKVEEPLTISKRTVTQMLDQCGVSESRAQLFLQQYDEAFGGDTVLSPKNLVDNKKMEVRTPDVTIQVNPERGDLVKTQIINGTKYILIRADDSVEVNGVNIHIL